MMERPPDVFDREREWAELTGFAVEARPGMQLALVRGRRRQGKSFLLRRLAASFDGFYYQALQEERAQSLARVRGRPRLLPWSAGRAPELR
jgi:hypothetical protein